MLARRLRAIRLVLLPGTGVSDSGGLSAADISGQPVVQGAVQTFPRFVFWRDITPAHFIESSGFPVWVGGRKQKTWSDDAPWKSSWQLWRGASPQQPTKGRGKDWNLRYDQLPVPASSKHGWAGNLEVPDSEPGESAGGFMDKDVQRALTSAKKVDHRVRKLKNELLTRQEQWSLYQRHMKSAFTAQKKQHEQDLRRLETELADAQETGRLAALSVQEIVLRSVTGCAKPAPAEDRSWEELTQGQQGMDIEPSGYFAEAIAAARSARSFAASTAAPSDAQLRQALAANLHAQQQLAALQAERDALAAAAQAASRPSGETPGHAPSEAMAYTAPPGMDPYMQAAPDSTMSPPPATEGHEGGRRAMRRSSPLHTGQRPTDQVRVPTSAEPPRPSIKDATMTSPTPASTGAMSLRDKLEDKRAAQIPAALTPFRCPSLAPTFGPPAHPPPPEPANNLSAETSAQLAASGFIEDDDDLDTESQNVPGSEL